MGIKNILYPHLMSEEISIWEQYLAKYEPKFDSVQYDVKVGTPALLDDNIPDNIREMSDSLTTKRIDAVAWIAGKPLVIELKPIVGMKALGQAITYPILLAELLQANELPDVMVIGGTAVPDMERIFAMMEIPLVLV